MKLSYDRLVLIHSEERNEVSTGYLINDGIIITCLHGLVDVGTDTAIGQDVRARVRVGASQETANNSDELTFGSGEAAEADEEGFFPAILVWPPPNTPANSVDFALLEIDVEDLPNNCKVTPPGGATLDVRRNDINGKSAGFPNFRADEKQNTAAHREAHQIKIATTGFDDKKRLPTHPYGDSRPLRVQEGAGIREVKIDRRSKHGETAAKAETTPWSGMSGAPVFANEPKGLLGVVQYRGDARLKDDILHYYPFAALKDALSEDAVKQFWDISKLSPPKEQQAFDKREVLFEKLDYLTRTQESDWFADVTSNLEDMHEAEAQCFMIMGHYEDDLTQCVRYLLRQARQDIPGGDVTYRIEISAGLPDGIEDDDPKRQEEDVETRAKMVSRDILSGYHVPDAEIRKMDRAERLQRIRDEIADGSAPRVWVLEHRGDKLTEGCLVLAQRLAVLLASLPKLSPPALVFLLMQTGYTQGEDRIEYTEKIKRVQEKIRPTLAIDLTSRAPSRFDQNSVEPRMAFEGSEKEKRAAWIKMLADGKWLMSQVGFTSRPCMSGLGELKAIRASDVDRWFKEFDGSIIDLTNTKKAWLREAFEARNLPAHKAKEILQDHPVFNDL
ncbi:MAG: hypothetical protein AAFX02_00565 [Pseudomonadota bacterium]